MKQAAACYDPPWIEFPTRQARRDLEEERQRRKAEEDAAVASASAAAAEKEKERNQSNDIEGEEDEEAAMMRAMGFEGFGSTKVSKWNEIVAMYLILTVH